MKRFLRLLIILLCLTSYSTSISQNILYGLNESQYSLVYKLNNKQALKYIYQRDKVKFNQLSVSGGIVNAYSAFKLAEKMAHR